MKLLDLKPGDVIEQISCKERWKVLYGEVGAWRCMAIRGIKYKKGHQTWWQGDLSVFKLVTSKSNGFKNLYDKLNS